MGQGFESLPVHFSSKKALDLSEKTRRINIEFVILVQIRKSFHIKQLVTVFKDNTRFKTIVQPAEKLLIE